MISSAFAAGAGAVHAVPFYANPAFWVGVSFFLVVGLGFRPVIRALGAGLDARSAKIKARIDEALKLREDASEMLATYQRKQRDAMKEAESIIAHAKAQAELLAKQHAKDLDDSIKRREKQALDRIAQAEAQAVKEVQHLAVDIAVAAAGAVIRDSMSGTGATALLDASIKDLPAKLH
jgi:F-type H+-transporting ATPase subunit b